MNSSGTPRSGDDTPYLMATNVGTLVQRPPVTVGPDTSVQDLARHMRDHRVSSVLVLADNRLLGIVTDRDLRNRVVATGLPLDSKAIDVATPTPLTVQGHQPAFDAMIAMARHNIHHLPVLNGESVVGVLSSSDLTRQQNDSAVYLASSIHLQTSLEGLVQVSHKIKRLQHNLATAHATAYSTGHIVTAMTDALTTRLLQLAEAQFGSPPVPYVWVAAGSQARNEQTAKSDQDNCLVLDNTYDPDQHGDYFRALTRWVCDGLDACGYVHCPGDMMAMNPAWCQTQKVWEQQFTHWIEQPVPKALMWTCVFFDQRAVFGEGDLLTQMRRRVLDRAQGQRIFLAHMVGNALTHRPPLGFLGGIHVIGSGEYKGTVDLKHTGLAPIVDLARVYALAGGAEAVNTHDRLEVAADSKEITEQRSRDLRDTLEFLAALRIRHQTRLVSEGLPANNHLNPDGLSNFEKTQLKDAFHVVKDLQDVLAQRYQL